jgi:hypothetical protein
MVQSDAEGDEGLEEAGIRVAHLPFLTERIRIPMTVSPSRASMPSHGKNHP